MVRPEGLEPPAYWFEASRSIQLSYGRREKSDHSNARDQAERYGRISVCVGALFRAPGVPSTLGPVAQLAEQQTLNLRVDGSIPSRLTTLSSAPSSGVK